MKTELDFFIAKSDNKDYVAPHIETIEVMVEKGFADSEDNGKDPGFDW